jgi:leishmanolysin-like peptidase
VTYEDEMAISDFTLALLEDSGWFKPNYFSGGLLRFGKNKGCEFLTSQCIDYQNTRNSLFEDEFFSYSMEWYPTCTTGRQSRAYNLFSYYQTLDKEYLTNLIPYDYYNRYFIGGAISSADYCPVPYHFNLEYQNSYFVGNCKLGNGNYGTNLWYNINGTKVNNITNNKIPVEFGEKYSDNSFCMMSSLVPKTKSDYSYFGTIFHPMCYPVYCSSSSLTVLIYNQYVVCPRQGGNVELDGFTGKLHCPDYNLICSGTVVCNDLFDCIDKNSLADLNTYDYYKRANNGVINLTLNMFSIILKMIVIYLF